METSHRITFNKPSHDDLQKRHIDDVMNMQTQIKVQGNEEALLQAQIESLQDRMSVEEQRARDEEKEL
eukprot:12927711-Prorocentrum_lima.AAC.1